MGGPRAAFIYWLIASAALAFAAVALWRTGVANRLLAGDHSHLSAVIMALFALGQAHVGWLAWRLSGQQAIASRSSLNGVHDPLPDGPVGRLLGALRVLPGEPAERKDRIALLLDGLERRLNAPLRSGWLAADTLLKLGLLGTVIGFVFMLGSVASLEDYDLSAMQSILTTMSGGMRVALYTTLTGLSGGLLLGVQYHLLSNQVDYLLADISDLVAHLPGSDS